MTAPVNRRESPAEPTPSPAPDSLDADSREALDDERSGIGVPFSEVEAWIASWPTHAPLPPPRACKVL